MFIRCLKSVASVILVVAALSNAIAPCKSTAQPPPPLSWTFVRAVRDVYPFFNGGTSPILLTDGTVLFQDIYDTVWVVLTPDQNGNYIDGTFGMNNSLSADYSPNFFTSAVLPDGRLIIEGGYNYNLLYYVVPGPTSQGAIYDPKTYSWTSVPPPPGWTNIGEAHSVVLPNGTFMLANPTTMQEALLDPITLTWTATGTSKFDFNGDEGWTLLPNGEVLTVDTYFSDSTPAGTNSEIYKPATGTWHSDGSTIAQLWDSQLDCEGHPTFQIGPGVLRPDGTVFYAGANTCPGKPANTAIYDSKNDTWAPGPTFMNNASGPAALEPNGKVLVMASMGFFEWDGTSLAAAPSPTYFTENTSIFGNMLVLPTGQILFTGWGNDVEIYTPEPGYQKQWAPEIKQIQTPAYHRGINVLYGGETYKVSGLRFNGMSQGAAYGGPGSRSATNYPLVRITNSETGHVFYCRTHDHSSMAVASNNDVYTFFDMPPAIELGRSTLEVVANGIPSDPIEVIVL